MIAPDLLVESNLLFRIQMSPYAPPRIQDDLAYARTHSLPDPDELSFVSAIMPFMARACSGESDRFLAMR